LGLLTLTLPGRFAAFFAAVPAGAVFTLVVPTSVVLSTILMIVSLWWWPLLAVLGKPPDVRPVKGARRAIR
jgi:hypothetical protein